MNSVQMALSSGRSVNRKNDTCTIEVNPKGTNKTREFNVDFINLLYLGLDIAGT